MVTSIDSKNNSTRVFAVLGISVNAARVSIRWQLGDFIIRTTTTTATIPSDAILSPITSPATSITHIITLTGTHLAPAATAIATPKAISTSGGVKAGIGIGIAALAAALTLLIL